MIAARPLLRGAAALAAVVAAIAVAGGARAPRTPRAEAASRPAPVPVAGAMLRAIKGREIGPAVMGGRVSDLALDPKDPYTFYVALATGGLAKSSDNGGTFSFVFEREPVASTGAVAVAPSDPKVVWLGTGEANDRNSSGWGNGVYVSRDAGATWTHAGLRDSRAVARIVVHPAAPDTVWVAAAGDLWNPGGERGLYRTTDGGRSWTLALSAPAPYGDRVGCSDVAIAPSAPDVVYAALYARRRTPWSFVAGPDATDGRDMGGIFKSSDGGATWTRLGGGLPTRTGRIGLSVHAKDPRIVVAVVQSDDGGQSSIMDVTSRNGGVFRSEDGGTSWKRMNPLAPRPFYFSQIRIDPDDPRRVYVLGFALHVSDDGGATFREDHFQKVHADVHALAVDPRDPRRLVLGTDGGAYQSFDRGKGWQHLNRIASGQFYRIGVDDGTPYRICGGLQDNLNWLGPSRVFRADGIENHDWTNIGGGDGFYCVFDPLDPDVMYAESQEGYVHRFDLGTGELKALRPEPSEGRVGFRFHWNSPLIPSVHAPGTMYLSGDRVFRLTSRGEKWEAISPDLSHADPAKIRTVGSSAENHGVVYALAESPVAKGLLWAGTDDGRLWVTRDDGGSWTDRTAALPAAARGQWINRIEPGRRDAGVAYLVVDAHRAGVYAPLVWRTSDLGATWTSLAAGLPADGPVRVLREDPVRADLLYAGTEFGLFASLDAGASWVPLGDLPTVAVDDLVVQTREMDLVVATHGRSLFVLDDLRPLQGLTAAVREEAAHLFEPRPAFGRYLLPGFAANLGQAVYRGANPPEGAILTAWVRSFTGDPLKIAIANSQGQPVANLTLPGTPGLNRTNWDLKPTKDLLVEYGGTGARFVPSGEYDVTMTYGALKQTRKLRVEIAPGIETRR